MDFVKLRAEAQFAAGSPDPQTSYLARTLLHLIDNWPLVVPEGYAVVKKPELLGKGVPTRHG